MASDEPISKRRRADPAAGDGPAPAAVSPEQCMELSIGAAALADADAAARRNSHAAASQSGKPATAPAARQAPDGSVPTAAAAGVGTLAPAGFSGLSNVARLIRLPGREVNPQRARLWQELTTDSVLFDVSLTGSDRDVHCNRFVLAEESCFFEKQFRRPEFARSDNVIDLRSIDGATLQAVVGSLFTAHLALAPDSIDAILQCADQLQLPVVKAACCEVIQESLSEHTVPQALQTADRYNLRNLRQTVLRYIKSTFFLMHRTSLEGLKRETLVDILSADNLIVFSEMQVFRAVLAWVEHHHAADEFVRLLTGTMRMQHLQPFEARSLLAEEMVARHRAATAAITEAVLNRLECSRPLCSSRKRDSRRFVWAIDGWSEKRRQKAVRSPHFGLAGSQRTWSLSYTSDKAGFHLTCVGSEDEDGEHIPYSPLSGEEAGEAVQLTMVLYHQEDYNRARRWRLPKCTLAPGEYQGFDWFFKDVGGWVRNDRLVVGVQLRLVGPPEQPSPQDTAASTPAAFRGPPAAGCAHGSPAAQGAAEAATGSAAAPIGATATSPAGSVSGS